MVLAELDLMSIWTGEGLPSREVSVVFNEGLGVAVFAAEQALRQAELSGDEKAVAKVRKEYDKVVKEVKDNRFLVTVKAAPEQVVANIREEVSKEFPDEVDMLGRPKANPAGDAAFLRAMWQAHIVKIVGPDGASKLVDAGEVLTMYDRTGSHVHSVINKAIQELSTATSAGFESAFKELDFL